MERQWQGRGFTLILQERESGRSFIFLNQGGRIVFSREYEPHELARARGDAGTLAALGDMRPTWRVAA